MKYKTLDDFDFRNKKVLVRIDINSEILKGSVVESERFIEPLRTIKELKSKGASVVLLAHQGRKGDADFTSLKQHSKILNKYLKVKFVEDIIGKVAVREILGLSQGEVILLENLRFLDEELKPSKNNSLVSVLVNLCDLYVNDAFSVSHREQTSIISFPKVMPSCIGRSLEHELKSLEKIRIRNCTYILGGSKPEENVLLLGKDRKVLSCGMFGQLCAIAKGYNLGRQNKALEKHFHLIPQIKKYLKYIETPKDFALRIKGKRKEFLIEDFPLDEEIFDIGVKTIFFYISEIKKSKSIFMKGTAGYCEERQFCEGTKKLLQTVGSSKIFSVIGGGHTNTTMKKLRINKNKFDYVSLAG
ncbi:MAG: phosphoglycerate kinase [Nanoarchaeota archaeon]